MTDVVPPAGRLIIVRHGRTEWNASRRFQGQVDVALDDTGRAQASAVGTVLAGLTPSAFVCSDLSRAVETASLIGSSLGLTATPDARLREIYLGSWQGLDTTSAAEQFPVEYDEWRAGHDVRRGGGETYLEVAERATEVVSTLFTADPAGVVLLVTHGGTARALIGHLTGLPHESWSAIGPLGNCRISVLGAAGARGWRLALHNGNDLGG